MENEEMPTLEQDLADIDARAAEARAQANVNPYLEGVPAAGAAVSKSIPAIGGWIKNLPKNLTLGTLDALSNTASTLWDGLRSELTDSGDYGDEQSTGAKLLGDKQYTNPVVPAPDPSTMTPEQLRAGSSDYAAFQQKQADLPIPIDVQAGQAYRDWRNSLREDDNLGDSLTQGVAQFAIPFMGYAKGLGVTRAPNLANFGRALAAEGVTSATAFDPHDGRFADLVDLGRHSEGKLGDVLRTIAPDGGLINAYIDYMTDRGNEGEAEGRFKNVLDNTVGSSVLAGLLKTAAGTIKAGKNLPKALAEHEMKRPGGRRSQEGKIVFHGSPHVIEKFDLNKIGTGEGQQVYGYGLYFAEAKDVANTYRESNNIIHRIASAAMYKHKNNWQAAAADLKARGDNRSSAAARALEQGKGKLTGGNLYHVDIPDEKIGKMLAWDAPMSTQTEALEKIPKDVRDNLEAMLDEAGYAADLKALSGKEFYQLITKAVEQDRLPFVPEHGNYDRYDRIASEYLDSLGIPGLTFYDGASRGKGQGTRNIVLFNDKDAKVVGKE